MNVLVIFKGCLGWVFRLSVTFRYHSYDPLGPFQNLPDVNKIEIKLIQNDQVIDEHNDYFDDK